MGGGPAGDLYLRLRLVPHPVFERRGQDLHTAVAVPVPTVVLGGEVEVPTMAGKTVRLKIPPFTQNGQVFRLKTYGMPARGAHAAGCRAGLLVREGGGAGPPRAATQSPRPPPRARETPEGRRHREQRRMNA